MALPKNGKLNPLQACAEEKKKYDTCFKDWYRKKFLKGDIETSEECDERFEELQVCINAAVEKARKGE